MNSVGRVKENTVLAGSAVTPANADTVAAGQKFRFQRDLSQCSSELNGIRLSSLQNRKLDEVEHALAFLKNKPASERPYAVALIFDEILMHLPFIGQYFLAQLPLEVLEIQYGNLEENWRQAIAGLTKEELAYFCRVNNFPPEVGLAFALSVMYAEHTDPKEKVRVDGTGIGLFQVGETNLANYEKCHGLSANSLSLTDGETCATIWFWFIQTALVSLYPSKYPALAEDPTKSCYAFKPNKRFFEHAYNRQTQEVRSDRTPEVMNLINVSPWSKVTNEDCRAALEAALTKYYADEWEPLLMWHNIGPDAARYYISGYQYRCLDRIDYQNATYTIQESKNGRMTSRASRYRDLKIMRFIDRFYAHFYILTHRPEILAKYYSAKPAPEVQAAAEARPPIEAVEPAGSWLDSLQEEVGQTWEKIGTAWRDFWSGFGSEKARKTFLDDFRDKTWEQQNQIITDTAYVIKVYNPEQCQTRPTTKDNPTTEQYETAVARFEWLIEECAGDPLQQSTTDALVERAWEIITSTKKRAFIVRGQGVVLLARIVEKCRASTGLPEKVKKSLEQETTDLFKKIKDHPGKYCPAGEAANPRSAPALAAEYLRIWSGH